MLTPGEAYTREYVVSEADTVPRTLPGSLLDTGERVLASARLVAMCEDTCWRALEPHRPPEVTRVGTGLELRHRAPALPGDVITIGVVCQEVTTRGDLAWTVTVTSRGVRLADGRHTVRCLPRHAFHRRILAG